MSSFYRGGFYRMRQDKRWPERAGGGVRTFQFSDLYGGGAYAGFELTNLDKDYRAGPSSLPLLYQNRVGADFIAASAETVDFALDKSQGVVVGAELIADGDFAAVTGWVAQNGDVAIASVGGQGQVTNNGAGWIYQALTTVVGRTYRIGFDWSQKQGGGRVNVGTAIGGFQNASFSNAGTGQSTFFVATATTTYVSIGDSGGGSGTVNIYDNISVKHIAGNSAQQATSGSRPAYTESGALRYLNHDGVDDYLASSYIPTGTDLTLAICMQSSTAGRVAIGAATTGPAYSYIGHSSDGKVGAGWRGDGFIVHKGTTTITGNDVVGLMRGNASTVELWLNGVREYVTAGSGFYQTVQPLFIGGYNGNGTPSTFLAGRIYRAIAVQRFIPDSMVLPLMRALGAGIVSF